MYTDFDLIVRKLSGALDYVNIYAIGDLHDGSPNFNEAAFDRWLDTVSKDPNGYIVIVGDMLDVALKNSKTDCFKASLTPSEQKRWLADKLKLIAYKILGAVQGNHEKRSSLAADDCPLYDVMAKLDLEDLYRENMNFIKLKFGTKSSERQYSYNLVLAHGASKGKVNNFSYAIDGVDCFITGHDHQPSSTFPSKIVIDNYNETVKMVDFTRITVASFQNAGGYTLSNMYMPQSSCKFPILTLCANKEKEVIVTWK